MDMYRQQKGSFLFIFLFFVVIFLAEFSQGDEKSIGMKLEMIHRHDFRRNPDNGMQSLTQLKRIKQSLQSDTIRQQKSRNRRQVQETTIVNSACTDKASGEMPLYSGADFQSGEYFVSLSIGSPPQKFVMIADTGSDLTWVNCEYRCHGPSCGGNRRIFHADHSWSFDTVPCSSRMCKVDLENLFSLPDKCPSPDAPCAFQYRYLSGPDAPGIFAKETVTFGLTSGREEKIHDMLVGCSEASNGRSFMGADGVVGLGYSNYSFALKAANIFGGKFSYCLVDHFSPQNMVSYLIFGSQENKDSSTEHIRMQHTELVVGVVDAFYAVNMKGISVGNKMLEIRPDTWNVNDGGGMILDSGTSLTFLTQHAYQPVMDALKPSLESFERLNLTIGQLEYCFNSTGFNEKMVPRLVFHFADGARFEPPVNNYVIDVDEGAKCLGFVRAPWPDQSIIGNIMQQKHFWEFDLANRKLSYGSSSCI
ncbi:Eukaryotic aspartyl protease family protein [Abeliophyllum distichum]|uniref:Eukaryotic aspartyl protease family protein n=1 Tax=Abeliophyllum distichum TaxID=126358 RepID=A0ABD1VV62_9LAMI